ncbi:hypothetical protein [Halobaculum sp. MBLA0143]|uniref:hypothetical protein n=1 Tax=Halobaculum sp. MBLA0143 TaxID=3079933 RepID=UPI0035258694
MRQAVRALAAVALTYGGVGGGLVVGAVLLVASNVAVIVTGGLGLAALVVGVAGGVDAPGAGAPETEVSAMGSLHGDDGPVPTPGEVGRSTALAAVGGGTLVWSVVVTLLVV